MTSLPEQPQRRPDRSGDSIPFWRDIRVLGVLAQLVFMVFVIVAALWLLNNVAQNLLTLGESQFLCRDGSSSLRCAFDFLRLDAAFDIAETPIEYDPSDSYARALLVGVLNTIKVTVIGIILATILGTMAGIARLSDNWLVNNVARWYVDLMRNTPLLVQLFFLFFGVILVFPNIQEAFQPFGLPVFLSNRGINLPWFAFMPSWPVWLAFVILGIIQAQVLWVILGRREEKTGRSSNRGAWAFFSFLAVILVGWFVTSATADSQGILVERALRVRDYGELEDVMLRRLDVDSLGEVDRALASGALSQEALNEAAFTICGLRDGVALPNLAANLSAAGIPFTVADRSARVDQLTEAYATGECEIMVADRTTLGTERGVLEAPESHVILGVPEAPVRLDVPRIEGLNFVGGLRLSPNFAAILIGLVLYTGGFIAEIVRAGIQSVAKGQSEAARALGLNESQRLRLIVLPQALRVIIPPMTSQYLNLAKNSSLAIAVGYPDLWTTAFTTLNQSGRAVQVFVVVMAFYLSISLAISALLNWYNSRIALVER
ncbi:MAG: ABC transporter permease subunit [Candidatus Promineifilaceae bacterium]|nr:ABC transporter permease subunit [Candidatus Promineifilaceae bacterium]